MNLRFTATLSTQPPRRHQLTEQQIRNTHSTTQKRKRYTDTARTRSHQQPAATAHTAANSQQPQVELLCSARLSREEVNARLSGRNCKLRSMLTVRMRYWSSAALTCNAITMIWICYARPFQAARCEAKRSNAIRNERSGAMSAPRTVSHSTVLLKRIWYVMELN